MFGQTIELMLRDLRFLGLIDLEIVEISQTYGLEFFVHLRKAGPVGSVDEKSHLAHREALLREISGNLGTNLYSNRSATAHRFQESIKSLGAFKSAIKRIVGEKSYDALQAANQRRLNRIRTKG